VINKLNTIKLLLLMYLLLLIVPCLSLYLNNNQYYNIVKLIRNKNLLPNQRLFINHILYKSHEKYALKQSFLFKKRHYYKCRRISVDEINQYARIGLYKSVKNYNGKTNFTYYSGLYINYELNSALTEAYSLSILPKSIRQQSKKNFTKDEINNYKKLVEVNMHGNINHWNNKADLSKNIISNINNVETYKKLWDYIYKLDPDIKYMVQMKYDYEFNEIRSNKELSVLLCCSYESIRLKIKKFKLLMQNFTNLANV